jgi:ferredoxin
MPYYGEDGKIYSSEQDAQKWGSSSPSSSSGGSEWKPTDLNAGITAADRAFDDQRDREWAEREAERRVKPVLELFDKHKSAYKFYGENKHKEAANDFAIVVNTLRDSGFQKYINDLIRECDLDPEKINRLNEELPKLCVLAGACYGSCVTTDMLVQGNFEEAIKYSHTALTYYSYSGIQKYVNMGISSLPNFYKEHADVCKKNGKTDEANDYYQRAVNIANAEQLAKFGENGIILNVTSATLNNDAEARYKAKNYALAEYLWKKAANEFGDSSAKQKIAKMQKEMETEAQAPQRQTSSAPSQAPQQRASSPKFCKQCGKALREGAKFCGGCGAKLG